MAGGRWLVAAGSSVRFFLGLGTVTDSVSRTAKASAQSTSSSSSCRLARASTGEGPCSFRPSSQSAACLDPRLPGNVRGHADHQRPSAGSQAQELLEAAHLRDNGTEGRAVARANNQIARATSNEACATVSKARAMANIARTCACASCCCCCCCCWAICTR